MNFGRLSLRPRRCYHHIRSRGTRSSHAACGRYQLGKTGYRCIYVAWTNRNSGLRVNRKTKFYHSYVWRQNGQNASGYWSTATGAG